MANHVFNIAKGAFVEKVRDNPNNLLVLLLKQAQADGALNDYTTLADMLAPGSGNVEADATNYTRKTGIVGTITVDNVNDRVDVDMPDQTWTSLGGPVNNTIVKFVVAYEESASDSGRIPISHHDFNITTDGSDVTAVIAASGFARAQGL